MKSSLFTLTMIFTFVAAAFAQDRTTVNAYSSDISDNLDLRAVASIFGDSDDLIDFERRLNDPKLQISNLDLNQDNQVDYLRVIETVEGNTHLIIIQSVIGRDLFQDVATVEVERDNRNQVQVQVVGDVYMYGQNYIYEPVYVHSPIIYNSFWVNHYRPYNSMYYWNYYPSYYSAWSPYPIYTYQNNVHVHINNNNYYNYVNTRRSTRAIALHNTRRSNAYERQNPNRSFTQRTNFTNRNELATSRPTTRNTSIATDRLNPDALTATVKPNRTTTRTSPTTATTRPTPTTRSGNIRTQSTTPRVKATRTAAPPRTGSTTTRSGSRVSSPSAAQEVAPVTRQAPIEFSPRQSPTRSLDSTPIRNTSAASPRVMQSSSTGRR